MSAFRTDAIRNPLDMQLVDRPFVRGHGLFGHCENFIRIVVSETFADRIFGKKFRGVLDAEFFLRRISGDRHDASVDGGVASVGAHYFKNQHTGSGLPGLNGAGKADVAYLPYRPPAEGLRLWHIGYTENCLLASPDCLKTQGEPLEPKDLAEHDLIIRSGRNYPTTKELICGEKRTPLMYKRIAFAGDVLSGKEVLLAAEGIAVDLSFHICRHEIEQGRLVRVLAGWHRPPWDLTIAVCDERVTDSRILNFCRLFAEYEKKASAMRLRHMHKVFLERDLNSR